MVYDYESQIRNSISKDKNYFFTTTSKDMKDELQEVYRKAKAFDEIVIETTGPIMNCPPGTVETEAGRITLDIIEKYDMEDK